MRKFTKSVLIQTTALAVLSAGAFVMPAIAHAADEETAEGEEDAIVVVGTRKRDENIQEVPITITALTDQDLAERNISSLADLGNNTPGVAINSIAGGNVQTIYMRGLAPANTTNDLNVEANVGVFIDGIYQSSRNTLDLISVLDVGQIEVAKGPQSALYGRSTFAGAMGISTGKPSDVLTGGVTATVGTDKDFRGKAFISGPLSDSINFRVAGGYAKFGGWGPNAGNPDDNLNGFKKYAISGALEFAPSDNFRAVLSGFYYDSKSEPSASQIIPLNLLNCGNNNTLYCGELPYPTASSVSNLPETHSKSWQASLLLEGKLDGVKVSSITGITRAQNVGYSDYDGSAQGTLMGVGTCAGAGCFAPVAYNRLVRVNLGISTREKVETFSQEVRLQSDNNSPFQWILGGSYFVSKVPLLGSGLSASTTSPMTAAERFVQVSQFTTPAATGVGGYDFTSNIFRTANADTDFVMGSYSASQTKNFSIFGGLGYEFGKLRINVEGRYNVERKRSQTFSTSNPLSAPGVNQPINGVTVPAAGVFPVVSAPYANTFNSFSPRITVDYRPNENVMLYGSVARGVRAGGFNTVNPVSATGILASEVAYQEEKNWTYEVGFKSQWLDNRLTLNAAYFHVDWKDAQVSAFTSNPTATNPARIVQNTGAIKANGFEVLAEWQVTDMFGFGGSFIYSDPKFTAGSYDGSTVAQCVVAGAAANGCPAPITITLANGSTRVVPGLEGKRTQRSVKQQWNLHGTISIPVSESWEINGRVDVNYTGPAYANLLNTTEFGERTLTNARLAFDGENMSVAVWATNIFDVEYVANSINQPRAGFPNAYSLNEIYAGEARRIGVTASYRF